MGNHVYRTGDLVSFDSGYCNNGYSINYVTRILEIHSEGKSWEELDVVTGWGDRNTKVRFLLKVLGTRTGSDDWAEIETETDRSRTVWCDNAHRVYPIDPDYYERKYRSTVAKMDRIMKLIRENTKEYQRSKKLKSLGI